MIDNIDAEIVDQLAAKALTVKPGDIVWLRTDIQLSVEQFVRLKRHAKHVWPDNEIVIGQEIDAIVIGSAERLP